MKYLLLSDVQYLLHTRWKILCVLLCIPLLFLMININTKLDSINLIYNSTGTNLDTNNFSLIELIIFMFNITISLFIIIDVYSKDFDCQLENLFLRISPTKWFNNKSICFLIIIFIVKIIQYLFITIFLILCNKSIPFYDILKILFSECIYLLLIQYLFLFLYLISMLLFKNMFPSIIIFLFIYLFLPKNMIIMMNYALLAILIIFVLNFSINKILKYKCKKIFEIL